ncbi:sodium/proline symporter [Caldithrix abyssi]|nr:sodium/proline symporter [Caldithrix abyssi]
MSTTIFFIIYLLVTVGVGVSSLMKSKKDDEVDFQLASRDHGTIISALSASASSESGWVLLGLVGVAYSSGINAFWILPAGLLGYLLNWYVVGNKLREFSTNNELITVPEVLSHKPKHYKKLVLLLSSLIIIALMTSYVAAQFNATGKALESIFQVPYSWGVVFGCVFVLFYALFGGFRAVSWTDVLQASMMVISLLILPIVIIAKIGGLDEMWRLLKSIDPSLTSFTAGQTGLDAFALIVSWVALGIAYPGQPHVLSRFMAAKDKNVFKKAPIIAIAWFQLVYAGAIFLGIAAKAAFNDSPALNVDPENALPVLTLELLPPILSGFALAAIIAAIASTADSQLLVVASSLSNDVGRALKEKGLIKHLNRIAILIVGLLAMIFALTENRVIFTFVLYAWSMLGASLGPVILFTLFKKHIHGLELLVGMLTGVILSIAFHGSPYQLILSFTISMFAILLTNLLIQRKND